MKPGLDMLDRARAHAMTKRAFPVGLVAAVALVATVTLGFGGLASGMGTAAPTTVDVPALAKPIVAKLRKGGIPVLMPTKMPLDYHAGRLFATGSSKPGGYLLDISSAPGCGEADACFVAGFTGERGKKLPRRANMTLRGGVPAVFLATSCGGSCAPASVYFVSRGTLYSFQVKHIRGNERKAMAALANDAVASGAR